MERERFVYLEVATPGGGIEVGTGYALGCNLILTADHVVRHGVPSLLRFALTGAEPKARQIVWRGSEQSTALDAALIWYDGEHDLAPLTREDMIVDLASSQSWASWGWVEAASEGGRLPSFFPLTGKVELQLDDPDIAILTFENPPDKAGDWSGISGAPVLIGWRIAAVIGDASRVFKNTRGRAVPLSALLAIDSFRGWIDDPDADRILSRAKLLEALVTVLSPDEDARAQIVAQGRALGLDLPSDDPRALASALETTGTDVDVLEALNLAHQALFMECRLDAADTVRRSMLRLLPLRCSRDTDYRLLEVEGFLFLIAPHVLDTMAEVASSSHDGRACLFLEVAAKDQDPPAPGSLDLPTTRNGPDQEQEGLFHAFVSTLAERFLTTAVLSAIAREDRQQKKLEAWCERLNKRFDREATLADRPLRHYLVFDRTSLEKNRAFLGRLTRYLPTVRLILLEGGDLAVDDDLCQRLRDVLHRTYTAKGEWK